MLSVVIDSHYEINVLFHVMMINLNSINFMGWTEKKWVTAGWTADMKSR